MDIWRKPIYLPYLQQPLTDSMVSDAEQQLGHKLPKEYIDLLKIQNGGYIRYRLNEDEYEEASIHDTISGIGDRFPSITDVDWEYAEDEVSFELNNLIPFDGDGHWHLCLDYRDGNAEPKVTYIDVECDEQEVIADSFLEYLNLLEVDVEDEYYIETSDDISTTISNIEKLLGISFGEPNTFDYGYPEYRTKYKDSWIWINPNKVQKGFVRENEYNYEKIRSLIDENATALRFPFAPENAIILKVSEDSVCDEIVSILQKEYNINQLNTLL